MFDVRCVAILRIYAQKILKKLEMEFQEHAVYRKICLDQLNTMLLSDSEDVHSEGCYG